MRNPGCRAHDSTRLRGAGVQLAVLCEAAANRKLRADVAGPSGGCNRRARDRLRES